MPEITFGEWLSRQRRSTGLTQKQLAQQMDCAVVTLRKIEAEERRPSAQMVQRLAEIFAIPPAERSKFLRFARGDWSQAPQKIPPVPALQIPTAPHSNLPAPVTALIGRAEELEHVHVYLLDAKVRLLTLSGPPGIGKTSLALAAARGSLSDFPAGVFFAALAPLDDPAQLPVSITQAIDAVESKNRSARGQLAEAIGDRAMLLVLDNCEHLIEEVAALVSELLAACPNLKILATSRESLRIHGEWIFVVPALKTPPGNQPILLDAVEQFPAIALFAERARAVNSGFTLSAENIQPVASICERLDGLPLAIELIAARMRMLTPQALLARLTDTFILAAHGMRPTAQRQKTLGNAISWSYQALTPEEQSVFASLAVFSGGFTLEAAESICLPLPANRTVTDMVVLLLDKSLLQRVLTANGEFRFQMLVTIQQYALTQLRLGGSESSTRNCHLDYFLSLTEACDREMHGPHQVEWIERVEREHDNIRSALEWGIAQHKTEAVLRMLGALGWPWEVRAHYNEALRWLEQIRAFADAEEYPLAYARLLNHLGRYCWTQDRRAEASLFYEKSQALAPKSGQAGECCLAETLNWMGLFYLTFDGENAQSKSLITHGLELFHKYGDEYGIALSTFHLGIVERERGQLDLAQALLEQSLGLFQHAGDLFFIARVSIHLGYLFLKRNAYEKTETLFRQHLEIDRKLQNWQGISDGWSNLGYMHEQKEEYEQANACYEACLRVNDEHSLTVKGPKYSAGMVALNLEKYELAFQHFQSLLRMRREPGDQSDIAMYLKGLAAAAAAMGQSEYAAILSGTAQTMFPGSNTGYSIKHLSIIQKYIEAAREQIGVPAFDEFVQQGRGMALEQVIQFGLK